MTAYLHTYNVSGTLPDGVYIAVTVQGHNAREAIEKAKKEEPEMTVTNIVRTLSVPEDSKDA